PQGAVGVRAATRTGAAGSAEADEALQRARHSRGYRGGRINRADGNRRRGGHRSGRDAGVQARCGAQGSDDRWCGASADVRRQRRRAAEWRLVERRTQRSVSLWIGEKVQEVSWGESVTSRRNWGGSRAAA